jgi:hypothetical protein
MRFFDTIAASVVLVHDAPTILRTLYVFLSNASGDRVVLASEDLPNSFGYRRKAVHTGSACHVMVGYR